MYGCVQKVRTCEVVFSNEACRIPPTLTPCRWPILITLGTLTKFEPVSRRICGNVLFRSSCLPSVLPEDRIGRSILCIGPFCDCIKTPTYFRPDLYRFDVKLEVYDRPARSLLLLPCSRLTLRCHRQADGKLSPLYPPLPSLTSFVAACVKLCSLPPPPPPLDRTTVAAVSSSLQYRKYKVRFEVNMNIKT